VSAETPVPNISAHRPSMTIDDQTARRLRQRLGASWAPGRRPRWFAVSPREFTGRRLQASDPPDYEGWFPDPMVVSARIS
jgi:hypothetical protein